MKHLESIYRNYDIRGEYPSHIHEEEVYKIGCALVTYLNFKNIAIGRDNRPSGDSLFEALSSGILDQGGNVVNLNLTTTPMSYFAGTIGVDATVMITASHMPSNFNGLKICVKGSEPLGPEILKEIESHIQDKDFNKVENRGEIKEHKIYPEWQKFFKDRFNFLDSNFNIVVDPANMIGILEIDTLKQFEPNLTVHSIYDEMDHTCPNHEANPVKFETLKDLGNKVLETKSDIGIAFDGDADRVGFVDENGNPVPSDIIGTIIAMHLIENNAGRDVVYTLTATRSLSKMINARGGSAIESAVGHTNVKKIMKENDAMLGIELSGHFFFKEAGSTEAGILPALYILNEMKRRNMKLSDLANEIAVHHHSGEINSEITLPSEVIYESLKKQYKDGVHNTMDGLKIIYDDWWFNVRPSANDPVMRLNLEADTKELMEEKIAEVLKIVCSKE